MHGFRSRRTVWAVACVVVIACRDNAATEPSPPTPPPLLPSGPVVALSVPTYDGSGQAVHPDVALTPETWTSGIWQFVATPYPDGNAFYENPSAYVPRGVFEWSPPAGLINPIVRPNGTGYLSDPDHVYNPEPGEMWLFYRAVSTHNAILLTRSTNGIHWTAPVALVTVANHLAISPAVVRRAQGDWFMWTVNGGTAGCGARTATVELRRSVDGVDWSVPQPLAMQADGRYPWHLDVRWIPERREFWAVFNGKQPYSCTTDALFLATSPDGVTWTTHPSPIIARGAIPEFADIVYRGALWYDAATDVVTFWHSGAALHRTHYRWRIAIQSLTRADLFARVDQPWDRSSLDIGVAPLQLTNETAP